MQSFVRSAAALLGVLIFVCLPLSRAAAQPLSLELSLTGGVIRNLQHEYSDLPQYAFYPELQLEATFTRVAEGSVSVGGALYGGFWDDGVNRVANCQDCVTYSLQSWTTGARILIGIGKGWQPAQVFAGAARHFVIGTLVGGSSWVPYPEIARGAFTTVEIGLRLRVRLVGPLALEGGLHRLVRLPVSENLIRSFIETERTAFQLGLAYRMF